MRFKVTDYLILSLLAILWLNLLVYGMKISCSAYGLLRPIFQVFFGLL